ncbi:MAG: DUF4290 domain-containing protein [Bacteroidota bacterium]
MDLDYNTSRKHLILAEYGRTLQSTVEYLLGIEDRDLRTKCAKTVVNVMAQLSPQVKDNGDYKQKLWDHLYIISDFKLDVDAPYPAPSREVLIAKPEKIKYTVKNLRYGHYGKNVENMIKQTAALEDSPEKAVLIKNIANHLKKTYLLWNRDAVADEVIYAQLSELSGGKINLDTETRLNNTNDILAQNVVKKKKFFPKDNKNMKFQRRKKRID